MPYELSADPNGLTLLRKREEPLASVKDARPPGLEDLRWTPFDMFAQLHQDIRRCPVCARLTHKWEEETDTRERARKDFSFSADGFPMASPKFKAMYDEEGFCGATFRPLSNGFFVLLPERKVKIDAELEGRRLQGEKCPACGGYQAILVGAAPVVAAGERDIAPNEIARTELEYGHMINSCFDVLVGDKVHDAILSRKLSGCTFRRLRPQVGGKGSKV